MSEQIEEAVVITAPKKRRGRPPKSAIAEIKDKRSVGRPKGDKAILDEYKMRMLASPKSAKVLEKVYEVALNDDHPGQMAALKLVLDRIVPASAFDASKSGNTGVPTISINISSMGSPSVIQRTDDVVDVEDISDTQ
jgi:hypothetical protein